MEEKSEKKIAVEATKAVDNRIAAVRDLIFGENILQYNTEFEDVFSRIKTLENDTQKNVMNVVTGSLCLFPSSLYHYTIPFESEEERIVLAFDILPT